MFQPSSATDRVNCPRHVAKLLQASVSSSVKWGDNLTCFTGWEREFSVIIQ